jgi:DMSO/TMAO reductase YedYZ molybdopterin-dependent catalytic subunit
VTTPQVVHRAAASITRARDRALTEPVHDQRTASLLGIALGISFTICFVTGVLSHAIQHPPSWFSWPPRPAGLYRLTQGVHVATGLAAIPLLLAKLWTVYPQFVRWPPVTSVAHTVERLMLVPLVCGSMFMLFSGFANIVHWYPWQFSFIRAHFWTAWITIGALAAHIGAKAAITRQALFAEDASTGSVAPSDAMTRRGYLSWVASAVGLVTITTVGQTIRPLRRLALLAPRRPDIGPQGLPVNGVPSAEVKAFGASAAYRFRVTGDVPTPLELTVGALRELPRRTASLPIVCVEGWSAQADWSGVAVSELLSRAGVSAGEDVEVRVESFQQGSAYQFSTLSRAQAHDRDTLIALELNGEILHPDHGYPARLIGPNRPGVQQTKWVDTLRVVRT